MAALRRIKTARLVLALAKWPRDLPPPLRVADTEAKARACSVLRSFAMRDCEPVHAWDLTATQAHDVARWAK